MLAIKLKPVGKKHQHTYRIVVSEKRSKLDGQFIEDLGWYNPKSKKSGVNGERIKYWMKIGAQPTATVNNILVKSGVIIGAKKAVHSKPKEKKGEAPATK